MFVQVILLPNKYTLLTLDNTDTQKSRIPRILAQVAVEFLMSLAS